MWALWRAFKRAGECKQAARGQAGRPPPAGLCHGLHPPLGVGHFSEMGPKTILGFNYCPPIGTRDNPTMSRDPALNRAHQKAFYDRLKQNPVLWKAFLDRKAAYKRRVRSGANRWVAVPTTAELVDAIVQKLASASKLSQAARQSQPASSGRGGKP
jgi:hypothetical protein